MLPANVSSNPVLVSLYTSQVATAATFSAAWLEALRMGFALLERPDGSLASPFSRSLADVAGVVAVLAPAALLASMAGAATLLQFSNILETGWGKGLEGVGERLSEGQMLIREGHHLSNLKTHWSNVL